MSMGNWKKQMETMKEKKDKDKNSKKMAFAVSFVPHYRNLSGHNT